MFLPLLAYDIITIAISIVTFFLILHLLLTVVIVQIFNVGTVKTNI